MTEIEFSWRSWARRHERRLTAGYLGLVTLVTLVVVLPPSRSLVLARLDAAARWWDDRWLRRLAHGEQLLESGRVAEAAEYLARLDLIHPAKSVRHGRDKERERLLRLLGRSYEAIGKRGKAIETYQRLVAFDSLNYRNSFELAQLSDRLLSGWAEAPEARDAYAAVLRNFPNHLPSVRGYVDYYLDRGEFIPVVAAYRQYLDAHLVQDVEVSFGEATFSIPVLVDGRPHDYDIPFLEPSRSNEIMIKTDGFSFDLERVEAMRAGRVGAISRPMPIVVGGVDSGARLTGVESIGGTRYRALDSTAAISLAVPRAEDWTEVRLRLALFKPVDPTLWAAAVKSFRNLLDQDGLREATRRTVPLGTEAAADLVLSHLAWARLGLGLKPNERPF